MAKDILGKEIQLGDRVVFAVASPSSYLRIGVVKRFKGDAVMIYYRVAPWYSRAGRAIPRGIWKCSNQVHIVDSGVRQPLQPGEQ